MWRLIVTLFIFGIIQGIGWASYAADVVVATWNMKWFPSGKADLRISSEFEDFKIRKAGEMLTNTIAAVGGLSTNNVIICVQEIRDGFVCQRLGEGMMMPNMKLAAVSDFADKAGVPIWQQCAILSNMPVVEGWGDALAVGTACRHASWVCVFDCRWRKRIDCGVLCSSEIKFELVWI